MRAQETAIHCGFLLCQTLRKSIWIGRLRETNPSKKPNRRQPNQHAQGGKRNRCSLARVLIHDRSSVHDVRGYRHDRMRHSCDDCSYGRRNRDRPVRRRCGQEPGSSLPFEECWPAARLGCQCVYQSLPVCRRRRAGALGLSEPVLDPSRLRIRSFRFAARYGGRYWTRALFLRLSLSMSPNRLVLDSKGAVRARE